MYFRRVSAGDAATEVTICGAGRNVKAEKYKLMILYSVNRIRG
jgi:hypothetical protein